VGYEQRGTNAGFQYSLIGGGNRMSTDRPLGLPSDPAIVDGYNQWWNLGAGTFANRTPLPANNGIWPNIIRLDVTGTNVVTAGQSIATKFYYQYGGASNSLTAQFYFDRDLNPYNTNSTPILQITLAATGTASVNSDIVNLATTNVPPGVYAVYGRISDGAHTRYLYAPEWVDVVSARQPPELGLGAVNGTQFVIVVNGVVSQTIVLQTSTDLQSWLPLATNTLTAGSWTYTNSAPSSDSSQFYRAMLSP
jgi:hypothetical protein